MLAYRSGGKVLQIFAYILNGQPQCKYIAKSTIAQLIDLEGFMNQTADYIKVSQIINKFNR